MQIIMKSSPFYIVHYLDSIKTNKINTATIDGNICSHPRKGRAALGTSAPMPIEKFL